MRGRGRTPVSIIALAGVESGKMDDSPIWTSDMGMPLNVRISKYKNLASFRQALTSNSDSSLGANPSRIRLRRSTGTPRLQRSTLHSPVRRILRHPLRLSRVVSPERAPSTCCPAPSSRRVSWSYRSQRAHLVPGRQDQKAKQR